MKLCALDFSTEFLSSSTSSDIDVFNVTGTPTNCIVNKIESIKKNDAIITTIDIDTLVNVDMCNLELSGVENCKYLSLESSNNRNIKDKNTFLNGDKIFIEFSSFTSENIKLYLLCL